MAPERVERRLAAILAADMVGYSQLMEADEAGTLAQLKTHRKEIIDPKIADHHGRIVKLMGDGMLAEFASVVDAVECAVEVQRAMEKRNADVPKDRQIRFRVGINLGDIVVDGDDIYGEGVNIAARLEELCEPGDVYISGTAYDQLKRKIDVGYEYLGERQVKNITEPVRVYRMLLGPAAAGATIGAKRPRPAQWRWAALAAGIAVVLAAGGVTVWLKPWAPDVEPASVARMAHPLPDKPSIIVLPFTNVSGEAEQEYFAEGMTDDLITRVSKLSGLVVISRTTAFTYKGTDLTVEEIARKAGVQYVLEGSVRRSGGAVRINAQLIDGRTGGHVWAEIFDRPYTDIFALQDEVQGRIVAALKVELTDEEKHEIARRPTENVEAFDHYLKAERVRLAYDWMEYNNAFTFYDNALALDPDFVAAHIGNARVSIDVWRLSEQYLSSTLRARDRAQRALAAALALAPDNAEALGLQARMQLLLLNHDLALSLARGAVTRHPEDPETRATLALVLMASERPDEAREAYARALALAPKPTPELLLDAAEGYLLLGETEKAAGLLERARVGGIGDLVAAPYLAAAYSRLGKFAKARTELEIVRRVWPWINVSWYGVSLAHVRNESRVADFFLDPLLKAGLSEWPYGFQGRSQDRLRGAELESIYVGRPHEEIRRYGIRSQLHDGAGNWRLVATSNHAMVHLSGTLVIEGDMLCIRSDAIHMGREYCGEVYKNPNGTPETNDEYVRVGPDGVRRYSIRALEKE